MRHVLTILLVTLLLQAQGAAFCLCSHAHEHELAARAGQGAHSEKAAHSQCGHHRHTAPERHAPPHDPVCPAPQDEVCICPFSATFVVGAPELPKPVVNECGGAVLAHFGGLLGSLWGPSAAGGRDATGPPPSAGCICSAAPLLLPVMNC